MPKLNLITVLNALIKHETLTINDLAKEENLGVSSSAEEVQTVVNHLAVSGFVYALDNVSPPTYTITQKGLSEGTKQLV